jgi:hypothetical protein
MRSHWAVKLVFASACGDAGCRTAVASCCSACRAGGAAVGVVVMASEVDWSATHCEGASTTVGGGGACHDHD